MNDFYNGGTFPTTGSAATSASMRAELASITVGFDKLPTLTGNGGKTVKVNSGGTALEAVTVTAGDVSGPASATNNALVAFDSTTGKLIKEASTVTVAQGGSGATTLTGVLKGNGTSAFSAATAGTDFVAPATATSFTAKQTFTGSTSVAAAKLVNALETVTVSATAATGTISYDVTSQSVLYYTSNASANWTINFRGSSGTSLDTLMATGESVTVVHLVTQGATAYYNATVQVGGTTSGVTTKWQGGSAPTAGNASSIDAYTYTIVKTGSATFTVFASVARFA